MTSPKEAARFLAQQSDISVNGHDAGDQAYRLKIFPLEAIQPEAVEWIWPKRIPVGKLTLLAGDPGLGKSYMTLDIAARISIGRDWPDGDCAARNNVLILTAEDDKADTVVPRLLALGADLSNIQAIDSLVESAVDSKSLNLQDHLRLLRDAIEGFDAVLLILDPILAFLGKSNIHRASDVRAVLAPLAGMAAETRCAILGVIHLNKQSGEFNSIYRLTGSLDFAAAARSVMIVGKHPEMDGCLVLAAVKTNLSAMPESLQYSVTEDGVFTWAGTSPLEAADLLNTPPREERTARAEARDFLSDFLANGPRPAKVIQEAAEAQGHSDKTIRRAKKDLDIIAEQRGQPGKAGSAGWYWVLPGGAGGHLRVGFGAPGQA